ncbi:MAG: ATP-dependent zinc metalloprotease FtsH, partial [Oscillospiraceae bacterium]|jgi:cell division protease FtsH|nr:ATP-dependent zinc metalloprotease FtsH [Oscillospiraceae bacterium]
MPEIEEATIKVVVGTEKKSKKISDKEKKLTAYHEAGHAVATFFSANQDPVHQISIIPRGMAGGYTMSRPTEDKSYAAKSDMLESIVVLLGGRVAEAVVLGDISTGASNDIERATDIARKMITKYGMSSTLGPISYGSGNEEVFLGKDYSHVRNYSETTAAEIDQEINNIITQSYQKTEDILKENIDKLHGVAQYLLKYEKMDSEIFKSVMESADVLEFTKEGRIKTDDSDEQKEEDIKETVLPEDSANKEDVSSDTPADVQNNDESQSETKE